MTFVEWLELGATATAYAESDALLPGWIALAGLMLAVSIGMGRRQAMGGSALSMAVVRRDRPLSADSGGRRSPRRGFRTDRFRARVGDPRVCRRQAALPIHHLSGAETGALARSGIIAARMGTLGPARRVTQDDGGDAPVDRCRSSPSSQQGLPHRVIARFARAPRSIAMRPAQSAEPIRSPCTPMPGASAPEPRRPARLRASAPPPPGRHERASGPIRYRRLITIDFWAWRTLFCLC